MTHQQQHTDAPADVTHRRGRKRKTDEERAAAIQERHPQAVAMLQDGATHQQTAQTCGISTATVSTIRRTLNIPTPNQRTGPKGARPAQTAAQRRLDDDIARLLTAGHTNEEIRHTLHVGGERVTRVLHERHIVLPAGRGKRTRAERATAVKRALAMLRDGATYRHIRTETGIDPNTISALRKQHAIPTPDRPPAPQARKRARTIAEVLALHTQPYGDGHARWTGPRSGHQDILCAQGRRLSARRTAFHAHHARAPIGNVTPSCTEPHCIAGPHLTDHTNRNQPTPDTDPLDALYESIFGSDQ